MDEPTAPIDLEDAVDQPPPSPPTELPQDGLRSRAIPVRPTDVPPDGLPPRAVTLRGQHVQLTPTTEQDARALFAALDDDMVWRWLPTRRPRDADEMAAIVRRSLADRDAGVRWPWTVRLPDGTVAGWTSYLDIATTDAGIEIGATAYGRAWWGSLVNPETKLLLLAEAFDVLRYTRVSLKTDGRNERSQRAIERLGAMREGVLRCHRRRADGSLRDTVYYSILAGEWPGVRSGLAARLVREAR